MSKASSGAKDLRIIAGRNRGRKIERPVIASVRPTKDRIRESIFNMVAPYVDGAKVIDLFAGSGAYGFEALSRGAEKVVFIDNDYNCIDVMKKNSEKLGEEEKSRIISADLTDPEAVFESYKHGFDLIFADPPYNRDLSRNTLIMVNQYDILMPSGLLVIEHHQEEDMPENEGGLSVFKRKSYGDISVTIYNRNE